MRITRTRRRAAVQAVTAVVMSTALAIAAAPAVSADSSSVTVHLIATNADGTVQVVLTEGITPSSLRISVRASADPAAPTLYTTDSFDGSNTTSALVRLPTGTSYGDYPVDVDFQVPGGTTQHWSGADHLPDSELNYRQHAHVSGLAFDRSDTDFDHRTAVLSGRVQALDPTTGEEVPGPGSSRVRLAWYSIMAPGHMVLQTTYVTTDADDAFQLPVTPDGSIYAGVAMLEGLPPYLTQDGYGGLIPNLPADPTTYRISAASSATTVAKGDQFTVRGTVQRLTPSGWQPFGGMPVVSTSAEPDVIRDVVSHQLAAATTGADGSFAFSLTAAATTNLHTFLELSPYLRFAEAQQTVYVPTTGSITLPAFTIDQYATVKTTGRLTGACGYQSLWLQYSPNGTSDWRNIAHTTTGHPTLGYCSFLMQAHGGYDGYYRVIHVASPQLLAVTGPAHRLRRTRTQMSLVMTPTRPAFSTSNLAASGVVIQLTGTWQHYAKALVVLAYRPKGDTHWAEVHKGYTDSAGRFGFRTQARGDGTWTAWLQADATHFHSQAKDVTVDVLH